MDSLINSFSGSKSQLDNTFNIVALNRIVVHSMSFSLLDLDLAQCPALHYPVADPGTGGFVLADFAPVVLYACFEIA